MKDVKELLNKEERSIKAIEEHKNILANIGKEKEELGVKKVAELQEILEALGCSHLLNGNIVEAVTNISINKGKVVEVVKEVEVVREVEVVKEVEVIKEVEVVKEVKDKSQDAYIKELEAKIQKLEEKNRNYKNNNKKLLDTIADLEADAIKINETVVTTQEVAVTEVEKAETKEEVKAVTEEVKTEAKEETKVEVKETAEIKAPVTDGEFVKLEAYKSERRDDISFYDNGTFYIMASNTCQEITVIPKNIQTKVTDEIVAELQEKLVELGFRREREVVSPAVVYMDKGNLKGYFARTEAKDGIMNFSDKDFFGGYIVDGTRAYLWSWDGKSELCATYYLDKVIVGDKNKSVTPGTAKMVAKQVKEMHREYLAKVNELKAAKDEEVARNTAKVNARKAAMQAHNAMFEQEMEYTPAPKKQSDNMFAPEVEIETNNKEIDTSALSDVSAGYLAAF